MHNRRASGLLERNEEPKPNCLASSLRSSYLSLGPVILVAKEALMDLSAHIKATSRLLAARSLVRERGYVAAPLCRPSLASIVTGLYPFQHGITGNDVAGNNKRAEVDAAMHAAFHRHSSFIKLLTANGYVVHQSGKWWEGSWREGGFTHGMTHGDPKRGGRHGDAGLKIGRESIKLLTDFIDAATTGFLCVLVACMGIAGQQSTSEWDVSSSAWHLC